MWDKGTVMDAGRISLHDFALTRYAGIVSAIAIVLLLLAAHLADAQSFTVLHNFTGGADGSEPAAQLTLDRPGNLYGTASLGGSDNCVDDRMVGCGTAFKLARHGSSWTFNVLYTFLGGSDGQYPETAVVFGPDGALYGTTAEGGASGCFADGCGTVFKLQPPATFCRAVSCPWSKTTLYDFEGAATGGLPRGSPSFDRNGNLYGTTQYTGGSSPSAMVFELGRGSWNFSVVYAFYFSQVAATPLDGVVFDAHGNIWGTTYYGGIQNRNDPQLPDYCGVVFELTPSGSGWTANIVVEFQRSLGGGPSGNLIQDSAGNFYGTLQDNGPNGGGTVFQLNPNGQLTVLASLPGSGETENGPTGGVVMDAAGNLYGVTEGGGAHSCGSVFKVAPSDGGWVLSDLHDFSCGSDGAYPYSGLAIDASGNLYGTTFYGGTMNGGVVFEITP